MKVYKFKLEIKDKGSRIDKFLSHNTDLSRRIIRKIIAAGGCFLNGRRCHIQSQILKAGDMVKLYFEEGKEFREFVLDKEDIIFEDEYFLIINKISGVPVNLSLSGVEGSIQKGVFDYFKRKNIAHKPSIIHRLDKGTSGCLIFAKNKEVEKIFYEKFRHGKIEKEYLAVVCGVLEEKRGRIKTKIARDPKFFNKYKVAYNRGKEAITKFKLLDVDSNLSLLRLIPKSGRPHQLRVHMSFYGNPILGDTLYGGREENRLYLHAHRLKFKHPITDREIEIKCLPKMDWKYFLSFMKNYV